MRINRHRRQRRSRRGLLALLGLVIIAGASFAGAYFWAPIQARFVSGRAALPAIAPALEEPAPAPEETVSYTPVSAPAQAEAPAALTPAAPDEPGPEFAPGLFALAWQLGPSEPVDKTWFDDAIFLGDSLLAGFVAHRLLPGADVIAVMGATPHSALEEPLVHTAGGPVTMPEAAGEKGPHNRVYIMLGSQGHTLDTDEFIEGYRRLIAEVQAQSPGATVYIMGPPPVAAHVGEWHPEVSRERVLELNGALSELARAGGLPFLNIFDALAGEDGYLPAHASADGLHLSAEYHFVLLDFLRAHTAG